MPLPLPSMAQAADVAIATAGQTAVLAANANESPEQDDARWFHPQEIDAVRWDQTYPYQLLVVRRGEEEGAGWVLTFPLPPESIDLTTNIANPVRVALDGVVETRGGAPLRPIEIAGTTGVLPLRPSASGRGEPNAFETVFAGTVAQARATGRAIDDLVGVSPNLNVLSDQEFEDARLEYQRAIARQETWHERNGTAAERDAAAIHRAVIGIDVVAGGHDPRQLRYFLGIPAGENRRRQTFHLRRGQPESQ